MSDFGDKCYTGDDVLTFDANIGKLKDAFTNLLPEIIAKGSQQQFTVLKEGFPCIRSGEQTNSNLKAQALVKDKETLNLLSQACEAFDFIDKCFQDGAINKDNASRDEQTAFMAFDILHAQMHIIEQSIATEKSFRAAQNALEMTRHKQCGSNINYFISKGGRSQEGDKQIQQKNIEDAFDQYRLQYESYLESYKVFSDESRKLALMRNRPHDINHSKHDYLNDILWKEKTKLPGPTGDPCSIDEYFARQDLMWSNALTMLVPHQHQPHQAVVQSSSAKTSLNLSQSETQSRKFSTNRVALQNLLTEINQEMSQMSLEELRLSLKQVESRHKVVEDLSLDPDISSPDTTILTESRKLMRQIALKIGTMTKQEKTADDLRKQEASANLRALGTVSLPNLHGFSDYLAWKKAQENLNTHVDDFKKAAVLLSTLKNPDDTRRCQGIYDYKELMSIIALKYSHQEKLVPALINKLRKLPEPQTDQQMQRNIDVILNTYSQLKSISKVAVSRFDATVVEDCILKLTHSYQERYEDFCENHRESRERFIVNRFSEDGSEVETVISGASREANRAPIDNTDDSVIKRNMFLTFLRNTETKLANMAARKVNLSTGGQKFQKCTRCKAKPCKCKKSFGSGAYAAQATDRDKACPICNTTKPHLNRIKKPTKSLSACGEFRKKDVTERRNLAMKFKACFICLNTSHSAKDCTRTYTCNSCKKRHNILLCPEIKKEPHDSPTVAPSAPPIEVDSDANFSSSNPDTAYLAVSGISIFNRSQKKNQVETCLWDSGSTHNFILDATARKLGYIGHPAILNLSRVGMFPSPVKCTKYFITLVSNKGENFCVEAYGMPYIGNRNRIENRILNKFSKMFNINTNLINNQSGQITLLMGMPNLHLHPTEVHTIHSLRLLKSKFGEPFMVIGAIQGTRGRNASCNFIDATIRDYILNDSLGLNLPPKCSVCLKSPPCKSCALLNAPISFKEQEEGKMIKKSMVFDYSKKEVRVSYPHLRNPRKIFPPDQSNYKLASKLAYNLKRSLDRDRMYDEYQSNWNDMIQRGVLRELTPQEMKSWEDSGNPVNYCSHHAVLKDSKSTKCRIVTNSSLAHNGTSLNAILPKGPNSISNLLHVLLRFRSKPYIVIADLSKAYNTVKTSELDAHLRRFLWFTDDSDALKTFSLQRMHFGDTPSGYYLECCKEEISNYTRETLNEPVLAEKLLSDTYVDDICITTNDGKEAKLFASKLPIAFGALGFNLKTPGPILIGPGIKQGEDKVPEPLLGHLFYFASDEIQIQIKVNFSKKRRGQKTMPNLTSSSILDSIPVTKRNILSLLASQYDPLGLASPFLVKLKIFQSKLFRNPNYTEWDTPVNEEDKKEGLKLIRELILASESSLKFPRSNKPQNFNLEKIVVFSDGSVSAFQTVLYGIFVGPNGEAHTSLLTAKNRVSSESVPRAELCGIVAGCRLILNYFEAVPEASTVKEVNFLTDSTCAIDWMVNYYSTKQIYVINRVLEIRKSIHLLKVPVKFYWIPSHLNIADKGTKMDCKFSWLGSDEWMKGPAWITELENSSAILKHTFNTEAEEDFAMSYNAHVVMEPDPDKYDIWSNLLQSHKLKKVLRVWCLIKNIINKKSFKIKSQNWSVSQINEAFLFFVKMAQEEQRLTALRTKQLITFEEDGILWTTMRFPDPIAKKVFQKPKLPVLPGRSRFAKLIMQNSHSEKMLGGVHCGVHQTLVNSRVGPYGAYITHAKQSIRGIIGRCVICRKQAKRIQDAKMSSRKGGFGEVPNDGSAFNKIAIDYFGPFFAKPPKGRETRGTKFFKIWGMAVLCQQTRAIKVYPIEGYDTQSFLTAFKIHMANHGVPTSVLSDPMSAFVSGAKAVNKEDGLADALTEGLADELANIYNVDWIFIPPGSQWRDPAERAIKSIKQMMDSVFSCGKDKPVLTLNEYWCLFTEISELLNRRPIQGAVFEDSLRMICPNDLLLGRTSKDQPVTLPDSMDHRKRLQLIQSVKNEFWKVMMTIFASDSRLFKYPTWYKQTRKPVIGDIVLVLYKSKLKDSFKIAKIENVSSDGRNLNLIVSPYQDSSSSNFKICTRMNVPTQRTILIYSPTDDHDLHD